MYNYNLEIHDREMSVYLYIVCVFLRWGSMCKRVHVRKSEKWLFWFVYIDLCGWQWNNYHTWQIPWFMFKLSASSWDMYVRWRFCFHTPYKVRKNQHQTGLRPLVCSQPEFATLFHAHTWHINLIFGRKKKEKEKQFTAGFILFSAESIHTNL